MYNICKFDFKRVSVFSRIAGCVGRKVENEVSSQVFIKEFDYSGETVILYSRLSYIA